MKGETEPCFTPIDHPPRSDKLEQFHLEEAVHSSQLDAKSLEPARTSPDREDPSCCDVSRLDGTTRCVEELRKPLVRFQSITIREYPVTIGDNPASEGPSLSVDWDPQAEVTLTVDQYEERRRPMQRRDSHELKVPPRVRWDMLLSQGYTTMEIFKATKKVRVAREQRRRTVALLHLSPIQEFLESLARKIKNIRSGGRIKREERRFLQQFVHVKSNHDLDKGREKPSSSSIKSSTSKDDTHVTTLDEEEEGSLRTLG